MSRSQDESSAGASTRDVYRSVMFVDMVTGPMSDWELVAEHSKLVSEPPDGLLACIALPEGDGQMRAITVWDTAGHRGEWAARVMMPLFESGVLAGVQSDPEPVRPVALFVRGHPDAVTGIESSPLGLSE